MSSTHCNRIMQERCESCREQCDRFFKFRWNSARVFSSALLKKAFMSLSLAIHPEIALPWGSARPGRYDGDAPASFDPFDKIVAVILFIHVAEAVHDCIVFLLRAGCPWKALSRGETEANDIYRRTDWRPAVTDCDRCEQV